MGKQKITSYEEFKEELLKNPQIRKEYEVLRTKYNRVRRWLNSRTGG